MKLSVCIFTYNHCKYITKAIDGALSQLTDFDYEIVIGDDCSSDGTREIIQNYERKYPNRIKAIYNQKNLGMMQNNINTILECKGEYIALLDGDDFWVENTKLQTQIDFLESNTDYSFCFHDGNIFVENGSNINSTCCNYTSNKDIFFKDVIYECGIPTFSIIFRSSAIRDYPPSWFKTLNAPDRPLFLLLADKGKGYYFDNCWGTYRLHSNGCWTGQGYQSRWLTHLQIYRVLNKHFNYRYIKEFTFYQNKVFYLFALELLRDRKFKRASCFIRRYISSHKCSLIDKFSFFTNIIRFYILFFKILMRKNAIAC